MNLTERYVLLCKELAELGYDWHPRAGDWMLDLEDESIGMLTMMVEKPELVKRLNAQIPYGEQIKEMLVNRGCTMREDASHVAWLDRKNADIYRCTIEAFKHNDDEQALAALVEDFRRHGA